MPKKSPSSSFKPVKVEQHQPAAGTLVWRSAGVVALLGLAVAIVVSVPGGAQALIQATSKQPEPFTELYFNNSNALPKQVTAKTPTQFSYQIVNHEDQTTAYQAKVTLIENGISKQLSTTTVRLLDGGAQTETATFSAARANDTLELVVELPSQNETIHFWSQS